MKNNDENTTQPLDPKIKQPRVFWENKFWHHKVHSRLGEKLCYFFLRVRPFDTEFTKERVSDLLASLELGSIRVFPIFGHYDFIVRAWLHHSVKDVFQAKLRAELGGTVRHLEEFAVDNVIRRWYDHKAQDAKTEFRQDLLDDLTDADIKSVQAGKNIDLAIKLCEGEIIQVRDEITQTNIGFFIAIKLEFDGETIYEEIIKVLDQYLETNPQIENASIYKGIGICRLLFKGQVSDYFNIAKLTNGLCSRFKAVGIQTETFLLHEPKHLIGDELIGDATFKGVRGVNLFVATIIPELYERPYKRGSEVEHFLDIEARDKDLTDEQWQLIKDYLIAFLEENPSKMRTHLFGYYTSSESFLREHLGKFIGLVVKRPLKEVYEAAEIKMSQGKYLSLGDFLQVYSWAIKKTDPDNKQLCGDWGGFIKIRNEIMHGEQKIEDKWQEHLKVLFAHLPRLHKLITYILIKTEKNP